MIGHLSKPVSVGERVVYANIAVQADPQSFSPLRSISSYSHSYHPTKSLDDLKPLLPAKDCSANEHEMKASSLPRSTLQNACAA
jgi:hypothetical protein